MHLNGTLPLANPDPYFYLCSYKTRGAPIYLSGVARETHDDGDYAILSGGPITDLRLLSDFPPPCDSSHLTDDNTSEEGKLLESVRDDSVTYASTRDLEPPGLPPPPHPTLLQQQDSNNNSSSNSNSTSGYGSQLVSPLAPVTVTVHTNEAHVSVERFSVRIKGQIALYNICNKSSSTAPNYLLTPTINNGASHNCIPMCHQFLLLCVHRQRPK